jgi:23S rRNA pseudouridine2604 synthase
MRINKYLSDAGYCSRREADKLIRDKKVKINKEIAKLGDQVNDGDQVFVNNKLVKKQLKKIYLAFNKPVGIICTTDTRKKDNIIDYINYPVRVYPIGRLDVASSGLILLTNDGSIVNKILKAENKLEKEYVVRVDKVIDGGFIDNLRKGVKIEGNEEWGMRKTLPTNVSKINDYTFKIVLIQGLNRQIRRMCEALGYSVVKLKRIRIGKIELGNLKEGKYKEIKKM